MGWEIEWCGIIQIPTSFFILLYPRGPFSTWKHFILNWGHSEGTIFTFTDVERLQLVRKIDGEWRPPSEILAHQKSNLFLLCFWSLLLPVCVHRGIMEREFCLLLVGMRPLRIRTTKSSDQHELLCRFIHISSLLWALYDYASSLWFTHICVIYWTLEFCHS